MATTLTTGAQLEDREQSSKRATWWGLIVAVLALSLGLALLPAASITAAESTTPTAAATTVADDMIVQSGSDIQPASTAFTASRAATKSTGGARFVQASTVSDYATCIMGVGVPVGFAWWLVGLLGSAGAFKFALATNGRFLPGMAGVMFRWYGTRIWNACYRFINS